ncbi:hypothetical protein LVJ94_00765 [Pendulispora rubella]|uniref:Altered inheritance of mitochondria protein 41 n=1 Tax=Pendulispora rubella TaxID=2741070 RepID=A0ABZ2L4E0_9BACT
MAMLALALMLAAGCKKNEAPVDPKRAAFQEVNRKLDLASGVVAGDDVSRGVGQRVQKMLTGERKIPPEQLKIAVQAGIVDQHRRIVILAKMEPLKKSSPTDRKMLLEQVADAASGDLLEEDELVIGIREGVFYGAIGQGFAHGDLEQQVGATLDTAPLENALAELKAK